MHAVPLIPRKLLFGNPTRLSPRLSPDGQRITWLAPVNGVMNIWLAPIDDLDRAAPLTHTKGRPIPWHDWMPDGTFVLFMNDLNGDENHHLYAVDVASGELRDLTPYGKIHAELYLWSPDLPGKVIVGINDRDPSWHDCYSIDLSTGARTLIYTNTEKFGGFLFDWQGNLRLSSRMNAERGGRECFRYIDSRMIPDRIIPFEDSIQTRWVCFNRAGTHYSMLSSIGRDTVALIRVEEATGEETLLAEHPDADFSERFVDYQKGEVQAIAAEPIRQEWRVLNPEIQPAFDLIRQTMPGREFYVDSQSLDDNLWMVVTFAADEPAIYHLLNRETGTMRELFRARPDLVPYPLAGMEGVKIKSRDGLDLVCYLSLPVGQEPRPKKPLPMVLVVHGGPWARDMYGYNRVNQWLANRGYAVLNVNYRASSGFGKAFLNAGDKEHAGKMHDDLIDAVEWAIGEGIADRAKVAIMGWSYGGYASFVGATFTPEVFCCTVPIVGITDLVTLMENRPPYWADFMEHFHRRYADVRTEEGRAWLRSRSPLYKVDQITKPMLIGHGANDIRCTLAQSDFIVDAMKQKGLEVSYVVYPDEGHGFARPENNLSFFAITESFLARHLGGRAEPVGGDFEGSSHVIKTGEEFLGIL